jgi:hypothetical protein
MMKTESEVLSRAETLLLLQSLTKFLKATSKTSQHLSQNNKILQDIVLNLLSRTNALEQQVSELRKLLEEKK